MSEVEIMGKRLASFTSDIHDRRFDALSELRKRNYYIGSQFSSER